MATRGRGDVLIAPASHDVMSWSECRRRPRAGGTGVRWGAEEEPFLASVVSASQSNQAVRSPWYGNRLRPVIMSPSYFSSVTRWSAIRRPVRRVRGASFACESLENRRLLSTGTVPMGTADAPAQTYLQVLPMAGGSSSGYSPQQIATAYGIDRISFSGVSGTGEGQTIAIVVADNDPNIASDLAAFDARYGLLAPPSFAVDNLGATTTDPGWSVETALDVEWAHAVAPQARIVLVEAPDASLGSLMNAVSTAAHLPGVSVVSMSWGTSEFFGEWNNLGAFSTPGGHTGETFVAASGDAGAWSGPSFPAVAPDVLGVGGSTLTITSSGGYGSESGWTYSTGGFSGLDDGFQYGFSAPSYQTSTLNAASLNVGLRTSPDVSLNANPNTGYSVYDSVPYHGASGWVDVGGTSAAAPAWAGLVAITDQVLAAAGKGTLTTTQLLRNLYSLPSSDFNQITSGSNGYSAGAGYNLVTGLGTPRADALVAGLLAANGVTANASAPTPAAPATATHASHATAVHNAAIVSAAATSSPSLMGTTATVTAGIPVATASLQTATAAGPAAVTAPVVPAPGGASQGVPAASVGFGQGIAIVRSPAPGTSDGASPEGRAAIDAVDVTARGDEAVPREPAAPRPEPSPPPSDAEPREAPASPDGRPSKSQGAETGATIDGSPAVRLETDRDARGGPAAGLVAAGAVLVIGRQVVTGRAARRRPLSWALRPGNH
jgi:hypothetical protein